MIEEAVRMWEMFREGLVGELENIPEAHWDWRPDPGARSVRELAMHILGSGKGFTDEILGDETDFMRLRNRDVQKQLMASFGDVTSKDEVVALVRRTGAEGFGRLREAAGRLNEAKMATQRGEQSRISGIWFAAAHEMYHRGQVATYARSLGIVPAMTQRFG